MAKKAKKDLTLEEKLQSALVADWEQPYGVPENWVWTRLGEVAEYKKGPFGSSITKSMFVPKSENTFKIYEQGNAIQKNENYGSYYITKEKFLELQSFSIQTKDIIVSCAGTIGEIFEIPEKHEAGIINQALMRIRIKKNVCKLFYLNYFSGIIHSDIESKSKGTAIKNIPPFSILKIMPFPLPPLAEQERIVQRIESLFAKLDTAKKLLEEALESFESRKSALLHQAFTGELTKTWREKHNVSMESWEESNIKKICKFIGGGTPSKAVEAYWNGKIPWASVKDVKGSFLYKTQDTITELGASNSATNIALENELLLITRISPGKPIITKIKTAINQDLKIVKTTLVTSYAFYLFLTLQEEIISKSSGSTVLGIRIEQLNQIIVNIPSLPEQEEIVRILDAQLEKEEEASAHIQHSLEHIEHMKKAILARAFRGELGTNNPEEASAVELLKEILEQE